MTDKFVSPAEAAYVAYTGANKPAVGSYWVDYAALSAGGQGAWQAAVDAARDHAAQGEQPVIGNVKVAESKDPTVKNQAPTGAQRT